MGSENKPVAVMWGETLAKVGCNYLKIFVDMTQLFIDITLFYFIGSEDAALLLLSSNLISFVACFSDSLLSRPIQWAVVIDAYWARLRPFLQLCTTIKFNIIIYGAFLNGFKI